MVFHGAWNLEDLEGRRHKRRVERVLVWVRLQHGVQVEADRDGFESQGLVVVAPQQDGLEAALVVAVLKY